MSLSNSIISGGAKGVDKMAEKYAFENNIEVTVYEPDWNIGYKAGPIRNQHIADSSTHILALPSKKSTGTYDTIHKARQRGIPVCEVLIDQLLFTQFICISDTKSLKLYLQCLRDAI